MAAFPFFNRNKKQRSVEPKPSSKEIIVGADDTKDAKNLTAFDNSNITYSSSLSSLSYDSLLRDKQANINSLYQLADYYTDADPIVRGIIKSVYVPFTSTGWYLTGKNDKTIDIFEEQYKSMRLREHIDEIFLQYYKYNNVFVYIWEGNIITLPPHKCRIGNTMLNGMPIVDFNVESIRNEFRQRTYSVLEAKGMKDDDIDDIIKKAYPPEIAKAIKGSNQYVTLDPHNVFVLQGSKEGWTRYAVPWIATALHALAKKELISEYETSQLNIGARPFIHARYGDTTKGMDILPDANQLARLRSLIINAMSGSPLVVTNHLVKMEVIQADLSSLYQWPMYSQVNADILAAGGIAGIMVNGESEQGSTFASAQVSTQAASFRIDAARREFEQLMQRINERLVEDIKLIHTNNLKDIPQFHFLPIDMTGQKAFRDACTNLWSQGIVSTKTLMEMQGYSLAKEKAQREVEKSDGTDDIMMARNAKVSAPSSTEAPDGAAKVGRPAMDNTERHSDPENAKTSKQAKDAESGDLSIDTGQ